MPDYIPDYTEQVEAYERWLDRDAEKYPRCDLCGERITDEYFYNIDGTFFHEECLREEYRIKTHDFITDWS